MSEKQKLTASYSLPNGFVSPESDDENYKDPLQRKIDEKRVLDSNPKYMSKKHDVMNKMLQEEHKQQQEETGDHKGNSNASDEIQRGRKPTAEKDELTQRNDTTPERKRDRTPTRSQRGRKRRITERVSEKNGEIESIKDQHLEKKAVLEKQLPVISGIELNPDNLNKLLPKGFKVIPFPKDFQQFNDDLPPDISKLGTLTKTENYIIPSADNALTEPNKFDPQLITEIPDLKDINHFKNHDFKIFNKLIVTKDVELASLSVEEQHEIRCMKLVLKIKNTGQLTRKLAMRNLTDHAKEFGAETIFNIILPLMAEKTLEEQERHILVKIIGRVILKLDDDIKPCTKKILAVVMPLLLDDDTYAKLEGREIILNLSKSAGLVTMINALRPDISADDDYVRNLVSRTFAVVANSLGIQSIIPFLRSVCLNKEENWLIRHTGIRIIQNIAILLGSSILPFLNYFVECVSPNIEDPNVQIRGLTAGTISQLAIVSAPYGFDSLQPLLEPLWTGLKKQKGKTLSQFMRAVSSLIPLMDIEYANYYANQMMRVVIKEMSSPDEDMKCTILSFIEKVCSLKFIDKSIIKKSKLSDAFFKAFWLRRTSMDKKISSLCVNACFSLSLKMGSSRIVDEILSTLKDESEPFRRMGLEACDKIILELGSFDLAERSVHRLLDGLIFTFQNQNLENKKLNNVILNGVGNILGNLGIRVKPNIMSITSAVLYRLQNKDPQVREQAADLICKMAPVVLVCDENMLLIRLGTILYESLGEVYPDVLGSILCALREVLICIKTVDDLNPPVSQILSTLTPILRNRHEKVQEQTIKLIGDIADKAKEFINHREWIRISFELLEMLKAYRKSIRKAANNTFGLIAQAIGPADVLVTLLNNLKMQERQLRVCTSVAIGIVAERCKPFTVLPALMNEYRVLDKNVQNGVLKSMSFMFEYTMDLGADYIYACTPLVLDALIDRDLVHRQIASGVVYHMAIGALGHGYEDAFINFLDLVWPNVFETSPHVINQVMETIRALNLVLGPGILMNYLWEGLYHPARKVRSSYWKVWNMIYIDSQHAMVPYLPRLEKVGPERLHLEEQPRFLGVEELDIWV